MSVITSLKYLRSWQTGEGRSIYSQLGLCALVIAYIIFGDAGGAEQLDVLLKKATDFTEIAKAYSMKGQYIAEMIKAGEVGILLTYMNSLNKTLITSRTKIKVSQPEESNPVE